MAVRNRLKEILDTQGRKQNWLARQVGVDDSTISNIAKGKYATTLEVAFKIAEALDVSIVDVFYYEKSE